jgi:FMN reductase
MAMSHLPFQLDRPVRVLVVGSSLNPGSVSQRLAQIVFERLQAAGAEARLLDLREVPLPLAGSEESWDDPETQRATAMAQDVDCILFSSPVYNYDLNAAAKNFVELMGGEVFENRTVGFICWAGGRSSFMTPMAFASSLMLDFRCWIIPRFIYGTGEVWKGVGSVPAELDKRLDELVAELLVPRGRRP